MGYLSAPEKQAIRTGWQCAVVTNYAGMNFRAAVCECVRKWPVRTVNRWSGGSMNLQLGNSGSGARRTGTLCATVGKPPSLPAPLLVMPSGNTKRSSVYCRWPVAWRNDYYGKSVRGLNPLSPLRKTIIGFGPNVFQQPAPDLADESMDRQRAVLLRTMVWLDTPLKPRCWLAGKRGSWNWNCPLKNEPQPNNPVFPANPHFRNTLFKAP